MNAKPVLSLSMRRRAITVLDRAVVPSSFGDGR